MFSFYPAYSGALLAVTYELRLLVLKCYRFEL